MSTVRAMRMEAAIVAGLDCRRIEAGDVELLVASAVGPRVLGFRRTAGPQMFASLPRTGVEAPPFGRYSFYGGHRLWAAPEVPTVTYAPDDEPVAIVADERGISILAPVDGAGLEKSLALAVHNDRVIVDHTIGNAGPVPVTIAPWAITQLAPGGTAILPLGTRRADEYQADRSLVAWPYTRWGDPLVTIGDRHVTIEAARTDAIKLGTALRREWLAYRLDDEVFVKRALHRDGMVLSDLGASGQVYCNDLFLELETLGPLAQLQPGGRVSHREVWELHRVRPTTPLDRLSDELELDIPSPLLEAVV